MVSSSNSWMVNPPKKTQGQKYMENLPQDWSTSTWLNPIQAHLLLPTILCTLVYSTIFSKKLANIVELLRSHAEFSGMRIVDPWFTKERQTIGGSFDCN